MNSFWKKIRLSVVFFDRKSTNQEGRREEILDEPEFDGTVGVPKNTEDHDGCEPLMTDMINERIIIQSKSTTDLIEQARGDGEDVDISLVVIYDCEFRFRSFLGFLEDR